MWRGGVVPCALFSSGLSSGGWLQLATHEGGVCGACSASKPLTRSHPSQQVPSCLFMAPSSSRIVQAHTQPVRGTLGSNAWWDTAHPIEQANPETSSTTTERTADGLCLMQILIPKQHPGSQKHFKAERGREEGSRSHQQLPLQLLYALDLLPAGAASAMEGEADNQRSVLNLVAVFEEQCTSKFPWRDKQPPYGQTTPATSQPQQLPASPNSRDQSLSQMAARHQAEEEEEEEEQQGRRGLSFKCLRSFRHKIREDNWRRQQDPGLELGSKDREEKKIALELLETEQAYVNRLHLLDQVFYTELMKEAKNGKTVPEEVVKMIFSNISSIYQFHAKFFLPELQKRMEDWSCNPRIGDVIQKLAPFLKMYGEYVKNFDKAVELITVWSEKSPPFQDLIADIQKRKACANLTLQHHMLEPVQRIPRYELLLKDYVRKLPPESPDRDDAEKALEMIFMVAKHSNAAIAEMERLQNLWVVYQRLGLEDDIVDPSNELIKEGPIQKISTRNNSTSEKYLFLFNNMLLYCVPKVIQVRELNDAQFPHTFLVSGKQRTLELQARSEEEMNAWIKAFQDAIDRKEKRSETFKTAVHGLETGTPALKTEELGRRAPQWVRDNLVTMCMRCKEPFNAIMRRRHHCRACGYVVCARCSDYKAELQYDGNRLNRVCQECYVFLTGHLVLEDREGKHKGILEKGAAEVSGKSLLCSSLQLLDKNGKGGTRGWFVIPQDDPLVLYIYAAPQDVRAHTSIPLLGYQVRDLPQGDSRHLFQLVQSRQVYTFVADTEELKRRWMRTMARSAAGITHPEEGEDMDSCDEAE
ncbi:FYVE, RhoGEF and PH domain-containing protein 2 isoform X2 [Aquila chrysaetos chrysaetos]|uniref:FYVE, RhoGEF and PH domain-containing protein 2 isoform X2 n=1 Tax=Aquila chrysaetos chrysaetos TaxID=223781 RepID=UPI001B7D43FC|nr:FYVE, RhoGEF and PH domain-containing protein 2 isoform X2 [Aquila chrysaetos chrysaetos]